MDARFMFENPKEIVAEMKIRMLISEWEELRDQLQNKYPSWWLSSAITNLLSQARKVLYEEHKAGQ